MIAFVDRYADSIIGERQDDVLPASRCDMYLDCSRSSPFKSMNKGVADEVGKYLAYRPRMAVHFYWLSLLDDHRVGSTP